MKGNVQKSYDGFLNVSFHHKHRYLVDLGTHLFVKISSPGVN